MRFVKLIKEGSARQHDLITAPSSSLRPMALAEERRIVREESLARV
jgi:hypothetical protein